MKYFLCRNSSSAIVANKPKKCEFNVNGKCYPGKNKCDMEEYIRKSQVDKMISESYQKGYRDACVKK